MRGIVAALAVPLALAASSAYGQGTMGTHFSGPTDADGAAAFWNPAVMARSRNTSFDLASTLSYVRLGYDNPETAGASETSVMAPQPFVGFTTPVLWPKLHVGVAAGVPYVSGARWSKEDPESAITRYYANDAYLVHGILSTSVAYELNDEWSLGAGINMSYSKLKAEYDMDYASVLNGALGSDFDDGPFDSGNPNLAGPISISTQGIGVGGILGFSADYGTIRWGASVHSPIQAVTRGRVDAEYPDEVLAFIQSAAPGAQPPELSGNVAMTLGVPLAAFAAFTIVPSELWDVTVDYRFSNSSEETSINVLISESTSPDVDSTEVVKGTRDRHSIGARWRRAFYGGKLVGLARGRFENKSVANATMTPNNADFYKVELGAALRWAVTERTNLSLAYSHFIVPDVEVEESLHRPTTVPSLDAYNHPSPTGTYSANAKFMTLGLGVTY